MLAEPSESEKVDDSRIFHNQIRRLIDAKIPICLAMGEGGTSAGASERICDQFETQVSGHGTIESHLANTELPFAYRTALEEWLQGARTEALDRLTAGAEGQRYFKNVVGFVLLQASLILAFLFLGMIGTCLWLLPKMESLQADSFLEPGISLSALALLRNTMPYWAPLILISVCIVLVFRRFLFRRLIARIIPMHQDSYALSEFQSLFSRPARFQWLVSCVVLVCGVCVLLQALSVLGVTFELLTQLVVN